MTKLTESSELLQITQPAKREPKSIRCWKTVSVAVTIALVILVIVSLANLTPTTDEDCIEHEGMAFCPGDCLIQEGGEEYCPESVDERPFLIYDMDAESDSLCNDGTKPRVHFRESLPGPHQNDWIFRFEGGNSCFDDNTCSQRLEDEEETFFLTAASAKIFYNDVLGGMLNGSPNTNPDWHDYNAVDLHYCTSDGWMGDADASTNDIGWEGWTGPIPEGGGWNFKGYRNQIGAFEKALQDFGLESASRIIVTGFSAGCAGVLAASERSAQWFKTHVPNSELFFLCDSGWFISTFPEYGNMTCESVLECPIDRGFEKGWDLWQPVVPESCLNAGFSGPECMVPEFSHPLASTREQTFVQENTYDLMQTELHVEGSWSSGQAEVPDWYRIDLAQAVLDSLNEKAWSFTSSNCDNHDSTNRNWMYEIEFEGQKLTHYFTSFMDHGARYAVADDIVDEDGNIGAKMNPTCPDADKTPHFHGEQIPDPDPTSEPTPSNDSF